MSSIKLLEQWASGCIKKTNSSPRFMEFSTFSKEWKTSNNQHRRLVDGWFSEYEEGLFGVFCDEKFKVNIVWNNNIYVISKIDRIEWRSNVCGRTFEILNNDSVVFRFDYMTWRRFIFRPWLLFYEIFVPDDDWGLVYDIPSFVHSSYTLRKPIYESLAEWNKRYI